MNPQGFGFGGPDDGFGGSAFGAHIPFGTPGVAPLEAPLPAAGEGPPPSDEVKAPRFSQPGVFGLQSSDDEDDDDDDGGDMNTDAVPPNVELLFPEPVKQLGIGLPSSSDEEEDDTDSITLAQGGFDGKDEATDEEYGTMLHDSADDGVDEDMERSPEPADGWGRVPAYTGAHALPAQLGLDPQRLQQLSTTLLHLPEPRSDRAPGAQGRPEDTGALGPAPALRALQLQPHPLQASPLPADQPSADAESQAASELPSLSLKVTPFHTQKPAAYLPSPMDMLRLHPRIPDKCLVPVAPTAAGGASQVVDAALLMGRSFRVGWGPGGTLVCPGRLAPHRLPYPSKDALEPPAPPPTPLTAAETSTVSIHRLNMLSTLPGPAHEASEATEGSRTDAVRQAAVELLEVHLNASVEEAPRGGPEGGEEAFLEAAGAGAAQEAGEEARRMSPRDPRFVPKWTLQCSDRTLGWLCQSYLTAIEAQLRRQQEAPELRHAEAAVTAPVWCETWRLVEVLFAYRVPPLDHWPSAGAPPAADPGGPPEGAGAAAASPGSDGGGPGDAMDTEGGLADPPGAAAAAAPGARVLPPPPTLVWREPLRKWLEDSIVFMPAMRRDVERAGAAKRPLMAVLAHLTGGQVKEAVEMALEGGDVRLGTLLAQGGSRSATHRLLADQLTIWEQHAILPHIDPDRLLCYKLLARRVDEVVPAMDADLLDWRRALALHMWYGVPPTAPLTGVLGSLEGALERGLAPAPHPQYVEAALEPSPDLPADAAVDLSYHLLSLAAGRETIRPHICMFLPGSSSPDPLDNALPWHLQSVLRAVPSTPWEGHPDLDARLAVNLVAQLEYIGGCLEWAVYVACHLADPVQRAALVEELLARHVTEWSGDAEKERVLAEVVHVPGALLAAVQADHAEYRRQWGRALQQRLRARHWGRAHALLAARIAPALFLQARHARLQHLARQLEAQQGRIEDWSAGMGLYLEYYRLQGAAEAGLGLLPGGPAGSASSSPRGPAAPALPDLVAVLQEFLRRLTSALARWEDVEAKSLHKSSSEQYLPRVVYSTMAASVSKWQQLASNATQPQQDQHQPLLLPKMEAGVVLSEQHKLCRIQCRTGQLSAWLSQGTSE